MTNETALSVQVGGSHYKDCAIQPIQYIEANSLPFLEGCVIKRVTRHAKPSGKGRQDIEKAIHELQLLLELRYPPTGKAAPAANDNGTLIGRPFVCCQDRIGISCITACARRDSLNLPGQPV